MPSEHLRADDKSTILFSLQFTGKSEFANKQKEWIQIIEQFLVRNKSFFLENNLTILLRHHPRYDGTIDISPIMQYEFIKIFDGSLEEGLKQSFLHMTFYSTTVFDASMYGIPTILWQHEYSFANIYVNDFEYPLGIDTNDTIIEKIKLYLKNNTQFEEDSRKVKDWYFDIYSPLDEKLFLQLFGNNNKRKNQ